LLEGGSTVTEDKDDISISDDEDELWDADDQDDASAANQQSDEIAEMVLLSVCRGLVTVGGSSRNIRFMHYTAETYFASEDVQREFFPNAQEQLAQVCIACLFSDTYSHPLYQYSSQHWGHHAQFAEAQLQQKIEDLFRDSQKMRDIFQLVVGALPARPLEATAPPDLALEGPRCPRQDDLGN
jgi:hypothetical protein